MLASLGSAALFVLDSAMYVLSKTLFTFTLNLNDCVAFNLNLAPAPRSSNPKEIIIVELKGYHSKYKIPLGSFETKNTIKWFFSNTLPFIKDKYQNEINEGYVKLAEKNIENNASNCANIRNVHVAASEVDGQLLLLHQIKDGAASSSFGLHVAKMAGIPTQVLNDAKRYLVDNLKTESVKAIDDKNELAKSVKDERAQAYHSVSEKTKEDSVHSSESTTTIPQQNQLFSLQDELAAINPDNLTPKQAHDLLYHLKEIISQ